MTQRNSGDIMLPRGMGEVYRANRHLATVRYVLYLDWSRQEAESVEGVQPEQATTGEITVLSGGEIKLRERLTLRLSGGQNLDFVATHQHDPNSEIYEIRSV